MREEIKVIKENLNFNQLPKDIQKGWIDSMADDMILSFDEGVYNKKTATIDAKRYLFDKTEGKKYVLFHSNYHGIQSDNQEDFNREEY